MNCDMKTCLSLISLATRSRIWENCSLSGLQNKSVCVCVCVCEGGVSILLTARSQRCLYFEKVEVSLFIPTNDTQATGFSLRLLEDV